MDDSTDKPGSYNENAPTDRAPGHPFFYHPRDDHFVDQVSRLLQQVDESPDMLSALAASELNISDLLPCHAAAVRLGDRVCGIRGANELRARQLSDQLEQAGWQPYYQLVWPQHCAEQREGGAISSRVLALPFDRGAHGWLLWFRSTDGLQPWTHEELQRASMLQAALLEICLERANAMQQSQRRLISSLGHGLCNPLQSISMSAALLKPYDERSTELRGHISSASESMQQQINRALEVNRLQGGERLRLTTAKTHLSTLLASEVSRLRNATPQVPIQASIESGIDVMVDAERITQAIRHLLSNAAHYATPGTTLNVCMSQERESGMIQLSVSNHAPELPPAQLRTLFSATRLGNIQSPRSNQLGIGLYMSAQIALAHEGLLQVHQQEGVIEFQLSLPGG